MNSPCSTFYSESAGTWTSTVRVLIVDDDSHLIDGIKRTLSPYNMEVIEGYHGVHGIWRGITERPDVVITDIRMPLLDGAEVVQCLRNNRATAGIPIIVLTGVGDDEVKHDVLALGVDEYFNKPVDPTVLLEAIGKYVPVIRRAKT